MSQLATTRIGWENEHFAAYLLSQIAFLANPATVSDDIGSDFFCTLFQRKTENNAEQLFPLNSFAIQVKTNKDRIPFTNKRKYLISLELPFFVGVVDRKALKLDVFSGENIPMMFSKVGLPKGLQLDPVDSEVSYDKAWEVDNNKTCILKLPRVATINASDCKDTLSSVGDLLGKICSRIHDNISAKKNNEYIFKVKQQGSYWIFAGSGSVSTFRDNLSLRLTEAFYNLEWLLNYYPQKFDKKEFENYEKLYSYIMDNPKGISSEILSLLQNIYQKTHMRIYGVK